MCLSYTTEYPSYKSCAYEVNNNVGKCKEVYKSCDAYNSVVTDAGKRKEEDCEAISRNWNTKCVLDKGTDGTKICKEVKKECKDFNSETDCNSYQLEDTTKKCIFLKGKCEEEYKNCESFKYDSALSSDKNKDSCESITPIDDYYDDYRYVYNRKKYKCVYSESAHTCAKEEIKQCEDYKGYSQTFCSSIPSRNTDYLKCALKNDQCTTQYKYCYSYEQVVTDESKRRKDECESIETDDISETCYFDEKEKECYSKTLPCSSYKGNSSYECQKFEANDDDSVCYLENGKCVEQKKYDYNYCSDYGGEDKSICESIQPKMNGFSYYYDYSKKCVYNDKEKECEEKERTCSEARNANECKSITPSDSNKRCIYKDNSCVEQYKTCESYANSKETIDKNKCESIVLEDNKKKCVYSANTCKSETKKCSDFKSEFVESSCYYINTDDDTKKCTYSNNACTITDKKTCLELFGSKDATKEICEAASTISDKRSCSLRSSGNGCDEVNKQSNKSFAGKGIHLNRILFALICLLL